MSVLWLTLPVLFASAVLPRWLKHSRYIRWKDPILAVTLALPVFWGYAVDLRLPTVPICLLAIGTSALALAPQMADLRLMFHPDMMELMGPSSPGSAIRWSTWLVLSAMLEELFFRSFTITVLSGATGMWSVVVSTAAFLLMHVIHPGAHARLGAKGYLGLTILGLGLGSLYYASHNLVACVLAHLLYNGPNLTHRVVRALANSASTGRTEH